MLKNFLKACAVFVIVSALSTSAFGDVTDDLFMAVQSKDSTPEQVLAIIQAGANVNAVRKLELYINGRLTRPQDCSVLMAACTNIWNPNIAGIIRTLINEGAYAGARVNGNNAAAFAFAATINPEPEIIRVFVEAGLDVNTKLDRYTIPLMRAARFSNNPEVVYELLRLGADTKFKDGRGRTARDYAAENSNPEMQKVFSRIDSMTDELFAAVQDSNIPAEKIRSLIKSGADIHVIRKIPFAILGKTGESSADVLMTACMKNTNPEVIRVLIDSGADVSREIDNATPMLIAAMFSSSPEVIRELARAGADVNFKAKKKVSPLMAAARVNTNPEVALTLILEGADMDVKSQRGFNAAMKEAEMNPNPAVKAKLTDFQDTYAELKKAYQELYRAVQDKNTTEADIRELVSKGVNLNIRKELRFDTGKRAIIEKWPLLMVAAYFNSNPDIIRILVNAGADVDIKFSSVFGFTRDEETTVLTRLSALGSRLQMIQALIDSGADVNARTKKRYTVLMLAAAAKGEALNIVKTLVQSGANFKLRNGNGRAAIDMAVSPSVREYLASLEQRSSK